MRDPQNFYTYEEIEYLNDQSLTSSELLQSLNSILRQHLGPKVYSRKRRSEFLDDVWWVDPLANDYDNTHEAHLLCIREIGNEG